MPGSTSPVLGTVPDAPVSPAWDADQLRAATDADIEVAFASAQVRAEALQAVLAASRSSAPWSGPTGVLGLVVELPAGSAETWSVRCAPSGLLLDEHARPDVEIRIGLVHLIRLLLGQADGALLYLAGALDVVGDEALLLAWGQLLTPIGSERSMVDAAALDPVAVSRAIEGVSTSHLAAVMAGGFRVLVLTEVFGRLPDFLRTDKAEGARVTVGFAIGGRPDGSLDRYVVHVRDGACTVTADAPADTQVDATLDLEGHEFLRLVLGHLNPVRAVLSGQLRVEGHVIKALAFNSLMRIPGS